MVNEEKAQETCKMDLSDNLLLFFLPTAFNISNIVVFRKKRMLQTHSILRGYRNQTGTSLT